MDSNNKDIVSNQVAEIVLSFKANSKVSQKPQITSSLTVNRVLRANWDESKIEFIEEFKVILLNRANRILGIINASSGGTAGTVVYLKSDLCGGHEGVCVGNNSFSLCKENIPNYHN